MTGHSGWIYQVLFLPSGRLASCSDDKTIRVWDIPSGKELYQLIGNIDWAISLALLPNGWLASGSNGGTIKLWDLDQKKLVRTFEGHTKSVVSLKVLKNGRLVSYSLDNTMKIWRPLLKEKNLVHTIQGHGNTSWTIPLFGVLSNDFLVTCSCAAEYESVLVVQNHKKANRNKIKYIPTGQDGASSLLVLSNDQVAIGFENGSIKIFDLKGGETRTIYQAHGSDISFLFQLSNENLVSSGCDGEKKTMKMWNLADLSLLQSIQTDHESSIDSIDISKDEAFLATDSWDNTIKIWPIQ